MSVLKPEWQFTMGTKPKKGGRQSSTGEKIKLVFDVSSYVPRVYAVHISPRKKIYKRLMFNQLGVFSIARYR